MKKSNEKAEEKILLIEDILKESDFNKRFAIIFPKYFFDPKINTYFDLINKTNNKYNRNTNGIYVPIVQKEKYEYNNSMYKIKENYGIYSTIIFLKYKNKYPTLLELDQTGKIKKQIPYLRIQTKNAIKLNNILRT